MASHNQDHESGQEPQGQSTRPVPYEATVSTEREVLGDVLERRYAAERQRRIDESRERCRYSAVRELSADLGPRYSRCTLQGFEAAPGSVQERVKHELIHWSADQALDHVMQGRGVFFVGSTGTGKDHLAAALLLRLADQGTSCRWLPVQTWFKRLADAVRGDSREDLFADYIKPSVLCLSDPVLSVSLTESQERNLYELVNQRYNRRKSTWVTCNFKDRVEGQRLLGPQTFSRLIEGAFVVRTNWEDRREKGGA
jgi:DNA replication protein DnaC